MNKENVTSAEKIKYSLQTTTSWRNRIGLLGVITLFIACNSIQSSDISGIWINESENCLIELKPNSTFIANNLPLDVENRYHLFAKDKYNYSGQGVWKLEKSRDVILQFNEDEWYVISVDDAKTLSIKLLDESGGEKLFFKKK